MSIKFQKEHCDRGRLRVAEIGGGTLFADAYPAATDLFWSGTRPLYPAHRTLTPARLFGLMRRLRRGDYDLVVVHPALYPPWHPRVFFHTLANWRLRAAEGLFAAYAMRLVHHLHKVPIVAVDMGDSFGIETHNLDLIDAAEAYFKRELPIDRWMVFHKSGHPRTPGARFRGVGKWKRRIARIKPLSLGHPWMPDEREAAAKETDVFYSGTVDRNSTVRADGLAELRALADEGFRIDIADEPLPLDEYLDRMGRAWLAWSPGGLGWDCYRHYEAARVKTVPLMNYPTVLQHAPFLDGVHCFYHAPEPGGLCAAVRRALADKAQLADMARAAAELVRSRHTVEARAAHIAAVVLGRQIEAGPVANADGERAGSAGTAAGC